MAKSKYIAMDGHFVESDYENALISFLEAEDWQYVFGEDIPRPNRKEVLYMDDLIAHLSDSYNDLENDDILKLADPPRWCRYRFCHTTQTIQLVS